MSSVHETCGEDIVWARRDDDPSRFLPPLEIAGHYFVIEGKGWEERVGIEQIVFKVHRCDPDKILAWEEYKEKLAAVKGVPYTPAMNYEAARERDRDNLWKQVLRVACPRCEVKRRVKCVSLARKHIISGELVELKNPHQERVQSFENWLQKKD